ncbi:hypothetical protein [Nitrosopumilus sp.]
MSNYCPKSPTGVHEDTESVPGLAGNTMFICKWCGRGEIDD